MRSRTYQSTCYGSTIRVAPVGSYGSENVRFNDNDEVRFIILLFREKSDAQFVVSTNLSSTRTCRARFRRHARDRLYLRSDSARWRKKKKKKRRWRNDTPARVNLLLNSALRNEFLFATRCRNPWRNAAYAHGKKQYSWSTHESGCANQIQ